MSQASLGDGLSAGALDTPRVRTWRSRLLRVWCAPLAATFSAASPTAFSIAFLVAVLVGNAGMPGLFSITHNLVIPLLRGSASAPQQLTSNMLGRALGAVLIGVIADQLHNLHVRLLVLAPAAMIIAAIAAAFGLASMQRDMAVMKEDLAHAA